MMQIAKWTTRTFAHEVPIELFPVVLERLRGMPARAAAFLEPLEEPLRRWSRDGSWSAKQHIGHLDDLHDLDMRRLKANLAACPTLSAADMTNRKTFEADHNATATDVLLARVRMHREELAEQLEEFDEADARAWRCTRLQRPLRVIDWM
jgi:hypothetical protein